MNKNGKEKWDNTVDFNEIGVFVTDNNVNFALITSLSDDPAVIRRLHN